MMLAASRLSDRLRALETGEALPTRPTLVKMAKQYRRPLVTFYMSAPPRRGERGRDFRTLPEGHSDAAEAVLDALIRDVRARQSMVRALLEDEEETRPLLYVASMRMTDGVPALVASIRKICQSAISAATIQPSTLRHSGALRWPTRSHRL